MMIGMMWLASIRSRKKTIFHTHTQIYDIFCLQAVHMVMMMMILIIIIIVGCLFRFFRLRKASLSFFVVANILFKYSYYFMTFFRLYTEWIPTTSWLSKSVRFRSKLNLHPNEDEWMDHEHLIYFFISDVCVCVYDTANNISKWFLSFLLFQFEKQNKRKSNYFYKCWLMLK